MMSDAPAPMRSTDNLRPLETTVSAGNSSGEYTIGYAPCNLSSILSEAGELPQRSRS